MGGGARAGSRRASSALTKRVTLSDEARVELAAAAQWCDEQHPGLGEQLVAEVDATIDRIEQNPGMGSLTPGVEDERSGDRSFAGSRTTSSSSP